MTAKFPVSARFLAALSLCAGAPARAAEPVSPLAGVWEGTIGTLPIRACFDQHEWGNSGGYYRSKRKFIGLSADADHAQYVEGAQSETTTPRWTINPAEASLEGVWTQGARSLPIRLTRVAAPQADQTACASMTFLQPRLDGIRNVTSHFVKDGVGFTRITVDLRGRFENSGQSTIQIDGATVAARKINGNYSSPSRTRHPLGSIASRARSTMASPKARRTAAASRGWLRATGCRSPTTANPIAAARIPIRRRGRPCSIAEQAIRSICSNGSGQPRSSAKAPGRMSSGRCRARLSRSLPRAPNPPKRNAAKSSATPITGTPS